MITVKDIREKEFGHQKHGYHEDEVDDFLDEIADQMETLIRENRSMAQRVEEAEAALSNARRDPAPIMEHAPVAHAPATPPPAASADDSAYFRNLETTLRETLLSAQRIADQTVNEARKKSELMLAEAQVTAEGLKRDAVSEGASLRASLAQDTQSARVELEDLQRTIGEHKDRFLSMLEAQMSALKSAQA